VSNRRRPWRSDASPQGALASRRRTPHPGAARSGQEHGRRLVLASSHYIRPWRCSARMSAMSGDGVSRGGTGRCRRRDPRVCCRVRGSLRGSSWGQTSSADRGIYWKVHGRGVEPLRLAAAERKFQAPESTWRTAAFLDEFDGTRGGEGAFCRRFGVGADDSNTPGQRGGRPRTGRRPSGRSQTRSDQADGDVVPGDVGSRLR
jgi:hypothetical protein